MKNSKIDGILKGLRGQNPQVDHENLLVDSIMDALPDLDKVVPLAAEETDTKQEETQVSRFIIMLRTISSVAAAVLIGLFIWVSQHPAEQEEAIVHRQALDNYSQSKGIISSATSPSELRGKYVELKIKENRKNNLISMYHER
ncbi:MAG: hypothetical protein GXY64_06090 [Bacteroidales bacterium]|nr:hypothetical protein [Bacteroidales bacterium]